jgi:hypothetical protein
MELRSAQVKVQQTVN